jgi:hypothetical protein
VERRKSSRIRCRFPCEILGPGNRASGTVLDLSEGGLSIRTALQVDQGESLLVRFQAPDGEAIEVEALLWHVRRVRDRKTGRLRGVLSTGSALASPAARTGQPIDRERARRGRRRRARRVPDSREAVCGPENAHPGSQRTKRRGGASVGGHPPGRRLGSARDPRRLGRPLRLSRGLCSKRFPEAALDNLGVPPPH